MKSVSMGFIGAGRITRIFLQAFSNRSISLKNITVCDTSELVLHELQNQFPEICVTRHPQDCTKQDIIFLALHPPHVMGALESIRMIVNTSKCIVSLAPKISMAKMSELLSTLNLARMIPNATSFINSGFNPICFHPDFEETKKEELLDLFSALGKTFETDEQKLESYALVSAMLPTYFWFQWNELQVIAQQLGLSEDETNRALHETIAAANDLYFDSGLTSKEVIDLIPVKPIAENEDYIKNCLREKIIALFEKIKA
ncbi:pyrroline-5-carboxylate reductase family protein [Mangrovibacterium diazotrophicum]|uniref:Pyrroline-5-carboxylate reductase n=1 Tax=Mangrovibacterium diazotrophicum TaxID=1261403 RepID=A0A419W782_9BACT|nr:NAD(P)-binding domain-containing protein [Mangrovibacterium diazotrophicum]RKD91318.1 pyrroline-5-carboxylate reductase [Mangrovibacterium diazotrophicum]